MKVHCKYDVLLPIADLRDYPKNPNRHDDAQVERLAKLYQFHGIRHPIIIDKTRNVIAAGHGRKQAAIKAGMTEFPVVYQEFESEEALYAFVVADNAIADWAELDLSTINLAIGDLGPNFDLDLLGIQDFTLDPEFSPGSPDEQGKLDEKKKVICPKCGELFEP